MSTATVQTMREKDQQQLYYYCMLEAVWVIAESWVAPHIEETNSYEKSA